MTEQKLTPRLFPFFAAAAAGAVGLAAALLFAPAFTAEIAANAFFAVYLVLAFRQLPTLTVEMLEKRADAEDPPLGVILLVTMFVVVVAVASLFLLINSEQPDPWRLALALLSVVLGWLMVHTMAAHHYAHEYYRPERQEEQPKVRGKRQPTGGLDFPAGRKPDGVAFLYFAYVIGMTAQVADVPVTSTLMRRLVLVQSVFAFFFNTVIVAAAVNVAVSLGK